MSRPDKPSDGANMEPSNEPPKLNEPQDTKWGERRVYRTDDCDQDDNQLEVFQGGNGDWYVAIRYRDAESFNHYTEAVRITTSGQRIEGVVESVACLYRALGGELRPSDPDWDPTKAGG